MQMFDVSIASPLKTYYGTALKKHLHDMDEEGEAAPKIRRAAVESFLHAWSAACTYKNCVQGALKTGTYPTSLETLCKNPFVRDLTAEEEARLERAENRARLNINRKLITDAATITEINDSIKNIERFSHLCLREFHGSYQRAAQESVSGEHNGCRLLSRLPPFITNTDQVIYFN